MLGNKETPALSARLEQLRRMVRPGLGLIDVGTDHGYLPLRLAGEGYPGRLFASDLREGPLSTARGNAREAGLEERIHFLLSDGLDACPPDEVDTIVIAGMGGDTICSILDRAEWCMDARYRLLLQPMSRAEILRYWLCYNGFRIDQEAPVAEGDTIYQIFSAVFCGVNDALSDAEIFIGKRGLAPAPLAARLAAQQRRRMETQLAGLLASRDEQKRSALPWLQTLVIQLRELEEAYENSSGYL